MITKHAHKFRTHAITLLMVVCSAFNSEMFAQDDQTEEKIPFVGISAGVQSLISANCFGIQYNPYTSIRIGKRTECTLGLLINKNEKRFTGFSSRFSCAILLPENSWSGKSTIYNFISVQRHTSQGFSTKWTDTEAWIARTGDFSGFNFGSLRFKGWQTVVGFGSARYITPWLSVHLTLGFCCFWNDQTNYENVPLYYEKKGMGLHMSSGIKCTFDAMRKSKDERVVRNNI